MDDIGDYTVPKSSPALGRLAQEEYLQPGLFPERISVIHAVKPNGADIAFYCTVEKGGQYYAKQDSCGNPIRATEYFLSSLALHLGINVPEFAVLENDSGETFFGSKNVFSTAAMVDAGGLLEKQTINELQQPSWIGQFISKLHAFDLFFSNDDRGLYNFLLIADGMRKNLYAIDFANSDLFAITDRRILLDSSNTVRQKKFLQRKHGFDRNTATNLVDNVGQVDQGFIQQVLDEIPADWLDAEKRKSVCESWSNGKIQTRVEALKSYFADGETI